MTRNAYGAFSVLLAGCTTAVLTVAPSAAQDGPRLDQLELPGGFSIQVFAEDVPGARSMTQSADGSVVYVGTQNRGVVYAVTDRDGDHRADATYTVAEGLFVPNGVAWRDGSLYVAEINRVLRYDAIDQHLEAPPEPVVVLGGLPSERHHGWKYLRFGPDGKLYFQVGAPCNVCEREDPYATIQRVNPDGSGLEIIARGVRNSVGFDWHPQTSELWFTDNGRDLLGDDLPPDELNRLARVGQNFGFPYCHGGDIPDPELGSKHGCEEFTPPAQKLDPHVAAIGMLFYTGRQFPEAYRGRVFIAEHGSWNRSQRIGYRVTTVAVADGAGVAYEPFAQGWLQEKSAWGRPADLLQRPDGSLLVSDDRQGVLYRISFRE